MLIKILLNGYCILATAIILNIIAFYLDIYTWYDLIKDLSQNSLKKCINSHNFINIMWLYYIYPTCLALGYIISEKLYHSFI